MAGQNSANPPEPIKIGLLSDMAPGLNRAKTMIAEFVRSEYASRMSRPVEFIVHEYRGAPEGSTFNAVQGFESLCDQGCLIVVGGNHSDNCTVVLECADRRRVPHISLGASEKLVSDYGFTVGWGTIPHDAYLLANWCKANGYSRITVTIDEAWHCQEYLSYVRAACERWSIRILSTGCLSQIAGELQRQQARELVAEHRSLNPQAILHFGSGSSADAWMIAVYEAGWDVPRSVNAAFVRVCQPRSHEGIRPDAQPGETSFWQAREGWHGTSVVDEDNAVLTAMLARFERHFGERPFLLDGMANYYDAMRVALEAVATAHLLSPRGVRDAVQRIKFLPAAAGGAGTVVGFGPLDHIGIKGKDPYVLRRIENGTTRLVYRFDCSL